MVSFATVSLLCVALFSIGLVHSTPSIFGSEEVYVAFSQNNNGSATLFELDLGHTLHVNHLEWNALSNEIIQAVLNQTTGDAILYGKTVSIRHTHSYYFNISKVFVAIPETTAQPFDAYFTTTTSDATTVNTKKHRFRSTVSASN